MRRNRAIFRFIFDNCVRQGLLITMLDVFLFWTSVISLIWLMGTTPVLLRNRFELTRLPGQVMQKPGLMPGQLPGRKSEQNHAESQAGNHGKTQRGTHEETSHEDTGIPSWNISVCIPVRNEEKVIEALLESLRHQTVTPLEVLVLDDQSNDRTPELLRKQKILFDQQEKPLTILEGQPKPADWLGKPWACHQLSQPARGDLLLFLDADTIAEPTFLKRIDTAFQQHQLDMLTIWPHQTLGTFWEKTVIPLMYYALVTLLPSIYVYRSPRWMPMPFRRTFRTAFAAACGQCIAFRRDAYQTIGGHEAVKQNVVEDVELARHALQHHCRVRMFEGVTSLRCRMYTSEQEMYQGFRKNFLAGFGNHLPLFLSAALIHILVFLMPFLIVPYAMFTHQPLLLLLSAGAVGLLLAHRLLLASWFQWNPAYGLLHPLGVLWFQRLGFTKVLDRLLRREHHWKGRSI